jgi:hypothetical protein
MNLKSAVHSILAALMIACFAVGIACNASSSGNSDDASAPAEHGKLGLNVNNANQVGVMLTEIEMLGWSKTTVDSPAEAQVAEQAIGTVGPGPLSIPVSAVQFSPTATLTASDTNNAIISVYKHMTSDSGAGVLLASASTFTPGLDGGTGNWTAFLNVNFTVVAGAFVSPTDVITVAITKNGLGVIVPIGNLALFTSNQ